MINNIKIDISIPSVPICVIRGSYNVQVKVCWNQGSKRMITMITCLTYTHYLPPHGLVYYAKGSKVSRGKEARQLCQRYYFLLN